MLQSIISAVAIVGIVVAVCMEVAKSRRLHRMWQDHLRRIGDQAG